MTIRKRRFIPLLMTGALSFSFMGLAACSPTENTEGNDNQEQTQGEGWENAVAAVINGENVTEQQVNDYVAQYRKYSGYEDDAAWATYLDESKMTAKTIRENALGYFAERIMINSKASELEISVTDENVQSQIDMIKSAYNYTEDEDGWNKFLTSMGYNPDTYKDDLKFNMLEEKVVEDAVERPKPTASQLEAIGNKAVDDYTGKQSYNVLFGVDDVTNEEAMEAARVKAQAFIDEVKGGEVTEAVVDEKGQILVKDGNVKEASNVGWDCVNSFVPEYQAALDALNVGDLTLEPVKTQYGYHVILCTGSFSPNANGKLDVANMPEDLYSKLETTTQNELWETAKKNYVQELITGTNPEVKDMPSGLPYEVDMSLSTYGKETTNENSSDEAASNAIANMENSNGNANVTPMENEGAETGNETK